jgi:hypothetical protein
MKKISLTAATLLLALNIFAQTNSKNEFTVPKNSVSVNMGLMFLAPSVEYGRILIQKEKWFLNGSAGIGTIAVAGGVTVPHQLTFNFGKRSSFFEVGAGGIFWNGTTDASGFTERESSYNIGPVLGWRKYCKRKFFFRLYMNPLVLTPISNDFSDVLYFLNTGFSFGYSF